MQPRWGGCDAMHQLTRCNDVARRFNILCGEQPLWKYCPSVCGCSLVEVDLIATAVIPPTVMSHEFLDEKTQTPHYRMLDMSKTDMGFEDTKTDEDSWEEVQQIK